METYKYKLKLNAHGKLEKVTEENPIKLRTKKYDCIYLIKSKNKIIRFGEGKGFQRIRHGFSRDRKYYSYANWRKNYKNEIIEVIIYPLDSFFGTEKPRRALEAELAFQFRINTKSWPISMTEIHFSEDERNRTEVKAKCKEILEENNMKYYENNLKTV